MRGCRELKSATWGGGSKPSVKFEPFFTGDRVFSFFCLHFNFEVEQSSKTCVSSFSSAFNPLHVFQTPCWFLSPPSYQLISFTLSLLLIPSKWTMWRSSLGLSTHPAPSDLDWPSSWEEAEAWFACKPCHMIPSPPILPPANNASVSPTVCSS